MNDFEYSRAESLDDAAALSRVPGVMLLAGGTTLLDLAKCDVLRPGRVVDIARLPQLDVIDVGQAGAKIGALATLRRVGDNAGIRQSFPAISESVALAASQQLRNVATVGGNLLQRTRCSYFRDPAAFEACNKRTPGSGCSALGGVTRNHAVLGTSEACIASYPGDLAIALLALDATVHTTQRSIAMGDLHLAPALTPDRETVLQTAEIVTRISVPASRLAANSTFLKVRDRQSFDFASASAAVALELEPDGETVRDIRVTLGGVAAKPWRAFEVEDALRGRPLNERTIRDASQACIAGAVSHGGNAYKLDLAPCVVARALLKVGGIA